MTTRFGAVTALGSAGSPPHTTPVATVRVAGRWWFATSRRAAKIALLQRNPVASITVADGPGWFTATGDATVLDPADPTTFTRRPAAAVAAAPAALGLLTTYARDVAGYLGNLADIPAAWAPHQRVLVAIDETIVERSIDPDARPVDSLRCIAGLSDGRRPIAVPGWFDGDRLRLAATARPIDASAGVAIMLDTALLDDDPGSPADQRGVLIRGRIDDDVEHGNTTTDVVAASITTWDGFTTSTRRFATVDADAA